MPNPTLYLFVGYPGAGKTTVARLIEQATGATHLWVDQERRLRFSVPSHSPSESAALYKALNEQTALLLKKGKSVIFDTNFNYRKDRDHLRQIASQHGAEMIVIWLTTSKELAQERALHETHSRRNGYRDRMSAATFKRLSNHLQHPGNDENFIKIDGTNIDQAAVLKLFSS